MKTCTRCHEEKPHEDFPRYPNGKLRAACRVCANEMTKEWMAHGSKGRPIVLRHPAAIWATRPMREINEATAG